MPNPISAKYGLSFEKPKKKVSFIKPRLGGAGGGWEPETKIEKGLRAIQPYMPTIPKLFEAGRRYPRALFTGLEALQKAEPIIPAVKKGFVPEIYAPKEKVRTPTQIAWDMADRTYSKKSTSVAWEFVKQLPFTTAGVMGSIFTDPAIFLTFKGINATLKNPQVAKFMGKEVKAPKWVDKTIRGAIKGFHRPLETVAEGVRENRINALTEETYRKLLPQREAIGEKLGYKVFTDTDLKGFIRAEFVKKGIYDVPLSKIQKGIKGVRGVKARVTPEAPPTEPIIKPLVARPPVEPPVTPRVTPPAPITPAVLPKPIAKPTKIPPKEIEETAKDIYQKTKDYYKTQLGYSERKIERLATENYNRVKAELTKPAEVAPEVATLIAEAKKFKTAEEFIRVKSRITGQKQALENAGKLALNAESVEIKGKTVWARDTGLSIDQTIRTLEDRSNIGTLEQRAKYDKKLAEEMPQIRENAKKATEAIHELKMSRPEFVNYRLAHGVLTKQQLTDIWKQAQAKPAEVTPPVPPLPEIPGVKVRALGEPKPVVLPPPPIKPPIISKGLEGPQGEGKDVAIEYEKQKDIWFGKKDVRVLQSNIEKRRLQKELLASLGKQRFDIDVREYDKAIQVYIDSKRNPEQVTALYDKLTPEQQKLIDLSQNLPPNVKATADKISASYEAIGLEAQEADVIKNVLDNYAARVWDIPKGKTAPFKKFGTTTSHAKQRKFETIVKGWSEGYNLKVEGATSNLQILREEIVKTIEDKRFIKALQKLKTIEGEPLLSTKQLEGYVRIEHPNFKQWRWAGKAEDAEVYGRNFFVDDKGNLFERRELYAPKEQATNLNNILGISKLKGIPAVDTITKYNAIAKAWILQTSFFHHMAFTRSYWFGTNQKKWLDMSPRQAYRQGLRNIEEENPIVMLGVKNGLTLGLKQDWNEELLREENIIGKILDKTVVTKAVKDKVMALRQAQADFLFGEFGAGLKAKSFLIEYRNLLKKHPDKSPDELAKMVANLINDDFGGLHLQRLGRNPTIQHIFRLFALAPDWTESNVRTMVKAIGAGGKEETELYRRFWAGIFTKVVGLTVMANLLMSVVDEDDRETQDAWQRFIRNYNRAWKEGRFRWMDVDITPLYRALGGTTEERKYFSILGHFRDPIKFIFHPVRSAHHKGSIVYRFFHEALTGVDWAGRKFTTVKEIVGLDKEKAKGKTVVWTYGKKGPVEFNQIPSFILHSIKSWQPIQVQNLLGWMAGEMHGFDAFAKSMGLRVTTTYGKGKTKAKIGVNPLSAKYSLTGTRLKNPITEKYSLR